jgi:hypothetical protein
MGCIPGVNSLSTTLLADFDYLVHTKLEREGEGMSLGLVSVVMQQPT